MSILWKRSSLGCCFDASYAFVISQSPFAVSMYVSGLKLAPYIPSASFHPSCLPIQMFSRCPSPCPGTFHSVHIITACKLFPFGYSIISMVTGFYTSY